LTSQVKAQKGFMPKIMMMAQRVTTAMAPDTPHTVPPVSNTAPNWGSSLKILVAAR